MEKSEKEDVLGKIGLFILTVIVFIILFNIYYRLDEWRGERPGQQAPELITTGSLACIELGCPPRTNFIGSSSGSVYHECSSSYARAILSENRVCFSSAQEAIAQGYRTAK